jgi:CubicO group peptidase (beta-lactamase class C family)
MARFCYTMLAGGVTPDGRRLFHAATVAKFTSRGTPSSATHQRALGWDLKPKARGAFTSSGHRMSAHAYGAHLATVALG